MKNAGERKKVFSEDTGTEFRSEPGQPIRPSYYGVDMFYQLDAEKKDFIASSILRRVKRGEYIYTEGEITNSIYYVEKGSVRTSRIDLTGKELSYVINTKGALLGLSASLYSNRRLVSAQAMVDCELYEMGSDQFKLFILKYPSMSERIIEALVKRVSYLLDSYLSFSCDSALDRLCKFLAYNYYQVLLEIKEKRLAVSLPQEINQSELATHLGISRQRTNELLHSLDKEKVIRVQRNTVVFLNPDYLLNYI